jgi:phosphonate transport system substrate-binding protein
MKLSRRWFLTLLLLSACSTKSISSSGTSLTIGIVNDDRSAKSLATYDRFKAYLKDKLQSLIEIDPVPNVDQALERIQSKSWSLVFAPPGLAAIAISQHQYIPLFPLSGVQNLRSAIVVREDSPIQTLQSLSEKVLALGQPGSVTDYYLPLFNLYGLTLAELLFTGTPKEVLEAIAQGKAAAGAVSVADFDAYRDQVKSAKFRILFIDPHPIPSGALLLSPDLGRDRADQLRQTLREVDSVMAGEVGLITNSAVPDYQYLVAVVERVRSIFPGDSKANTALLQQKPVRLFTTAPTKTERGSDLKS